MSIAPTTAACQMRISSGLSETSLRIWLPPVKAMCATTAIATAPISRPPSLPSRWRHAAAKSEPKHRGGLIAIDLGLVQVYEVQHRHEERRHEYRRCDQAGDVEDEHAREAGDERPPKLVDLVVAQVRKQGGDDRGLGDMLTRMSRVSVLTKLGVAELFGRALVGTTARAEDAIGDVVRA